MNSGVLTYQPIPVDEAAKEWFNDPALVAAYDALAEEFALAEAAIRARAEGEAEHRHAADRPMAEPS